MTNNEAIKRIQEKIRYMTSKIAESPTTDRANFWREQDCAAFELAIAALEYAEQMRLYEESAKVPR